MLNLPIALVLKRMLAAGICVFVSSAGAQAGCSWVWTAPAVLSRPSAQLNLEPQVGMDAAGGAFAAWTELDPDLTEHILVSRRPPGGDWLPPQEIAQTTPSNGTDEFPSEIDLAVSPAGHALVTWRRQDIASASRPWVASFDPATGWSAPLDLRVPGVRSMHRASVAINQHGQGVVAWKSDSRVYVRLLDPATGWSPAQVQRLAGNGWAPPETRVAINAAGQVAVAWDALLPTVARYAPAVGWSAPEVLMRTGRVDFRRVPELALAPSGDLFLAWSHLPKGEDKLRIHVAQHQAGVGWAPVRVLSIASQQAVEPDVAVNADGQAVVAWVVAKPWSLARLEGVSYQPGLGWSPRARINPDRDPPGSYAAPKVHLSDAGLATVTSRWWSGVAGTVESHSAPFGRWARAQLTTHDGMGPNIDAAGAATGPLAVSGVVWGSGPLGDRGDRLDVRLRERRCEGAQTAVPPL